MKVKTVTTVHVALKEREGMAAVRAMQIALNSGKLLPQDVLPVQQLHDALTDGTAPQSHPIGKAVSHGTTR